MDKKRRRSSYQRRLIMEEDDSSRRPKFSTSTSGWVSGRNEPIGDLNLVHAFLGIRLKVSRESIDNIKAHTVKFRISNKTQYEPYLEGNDHRVYDIIQLCPKEYVFNPPAEMTVRLPSCVNQKSAGQVVCMFSNSFAVGNDTRYLQWGRIDSKLFLINPLRTEAKIICKYAGFYTLILTQCPEVTTKVIPCQGINVQVQDYPGIKITYSTSCVDSDTKVTIKVVRFEDLYNSPSASPTFNDSRRRLPIQIRENVNEDMVDVTGSPVVLVRPIRTRFRKPVKLSLPLLGNEFSGFFEKESNRLVVLRSRELEEDSIIWHHHYSTPEVETTVNGKKTATFLITSGGLFKVVRRLPNKHMRFIEQVSNRISRELCTSTSPDVMVTSLLKGFITEIAEPGKQFVLRISLLDSSQPQNPDSCFAYEVCCQPLTVPLGKVRFLVRGRFEPDRDVADHSEERTVMFTGKTTFVDFNLKLRLSDPTKLPETIGKVTIHSTSEMQYYITLQKPTPIPKEAPFKQEGETRRPRDLRQKKPLLRRHTVSTLSTAHVTDSSRDAASDNLNAKERRQVSSSFAAVSRLEAIGDEEAEQEEVEEEEEEEEEKEEVAINSQSTASYTSISVGSSSSNGETVSKNSEHFNHADAGTKSSKVHTSGLDEDHDQREGNDGNEGSPRLHHSQSSLKSDKQGRDDDCSDWSSSYDVTREEGQQSMSMDSLESLVTEDKDKDEEKFKENKIEKSDRNVRIDDKNHDNEDQHISENNENDLTENGENLEDNNTDGNEMKQRKNRLRKSSDASARSDNDKTSYCSFERRPDSVESRCRDVLEGKEQDVSAPRRTSYSSLTSDSISIDSQIQIKENKSIVS